jgi:hypothetical protein
MRNLIKNYAPSVFIIIITPLYILLPILIATSAVAVLAVLSSKYLTSVLAIEQKQFKAPIAVGITFKASVIS